jgi:hypothetical protein
MVLLLLACFICIAAFSWFLLSDEKGPNSDVTATRSTKEQGGKAKPSKANKRSYRKKKRALSSAAVAGTSSLLSSRQLSTPKENEVRHAQHDDDVVASTKAAVAGAASSSPEAADVVDSRAAAGPVASTETVAATVPTSKKGVAAALPSTTAAAAAASVASTKLAVAAVVKVGGRLSTAVVINSAAKSHGAFGVSRLTAKGRAMYSDRLSCAPFPNADTQKLVFGFVGKKQWLVIGAVCRQWQYMYKQYVEARYMEPNWQPRKWQRCDTSIAYDTYSDTAYSAVFASQSTLEMGISSCALDLHATTAQHNAGRYCSESVLLAAHKRGLPWSAAVLKGVVASGCASKMQWLLTQREWKLTTGIADFAAECSSVEMLQLLQQHKVAFTAETAMKAVLPGRLHIVQYLLNQDCPTDGRTAVAAAECGALDILQFLHSSGYYIDFDSAVATASGGGHLKLVAWLEEQGAELSSDALKRAAIFGHIEVCEYLMQRGCVWTAEITDTCIVCSRELIPWILSQGITLTAEQQVELDKPARSALYSYYDSAL